MFSIITKSSTIRNAKYFWLLITYMLGTNLDWQLNCSLKLCSIIWKVFLNKRKKKIKKILLIYVFKDDFGHFDLRNCQLLVILNGHSIKSFEGKSLFFKHHWATTHLLCYTVITVTHVLIACVLNKIWFLLGWCAINVNNSIKL